MFFIISKLLINFIYPFTWIVIFFIAALFTKDEKRKRRFLKICFILLIIFTNPFLFDQFARKWDTPPQRLQDSAHYSCAILLGGFAGEDYEQEGHFGPSADRFIQAVKLQKSGKVSHILMTGGSPNLINTKFREADFVINELKAMGVPDSAILSERDSRNTLENALISKKLLDSAHLSPPYILITSGFHMPRALYIFKKKGMDVVPYPCNYFAGREKTSLSSFIPSIGVLGGWEFYIKEMVGYVAYRFK